MKIILFAPGRSIHTHKWAMHYVEKGMDVKVITFKDHYCSTNAKSVETIVLPKVLPGKMSYLFNVISMKKLLKKYKPDILHAHFASSYGLIGSLAKNCKFFVSVWGTDIYKFPQKGKINEWIIRYTLDKADQICSTSHTMAEETKKYTTKNIEVIPFGVDIKKFRPINKSKDREGNVIIGIVKSMADNYGISDLIFAFSKVNAKHKNTKLLIVGDGPKKRNYEQLVEDNNFKEVVTFTGRVPNDEVPNYINQMDIFVVPSREIESFGVSAVEAMACGVPVVVTDIGGLPEVVVHRKTGIVVPNNNNNKLSTAIDFLVENEEIRKDFGFEGVKHVHNKYIWTDNANQMIELYNAELKKD